MLRRTVGRHDLSTIEGQSAAVAAGLPMIEQLRDPIRQTEYGHLLAELAGVAEASVALALDRRIAGRPVEVQQAIKRASAQEKVEREMLRLLARDAEVYAELSPRLSADHFLMTRTRELYALIGETAGDVAAYVGRSQDDKAVRSLSALTLEPLDGEGSVAYAEDVWARLQEFALKRKSSALRQRLQKLNPTTDDDYDGLFEELIAIDGELRRLRERGNVHA
jgi:DNA primase